MAGRADLQCAAARAVKSTFQRLRQHLHVLGNIGSGQAEYSVRSRGGGQPAEHSSRCCALSRRVVGEELAQAGLRAYCIRPL